MTEKKKVGGWRPGAGRKPLPLEQKKTTLSLWVTAAEREKLLQFLQELREEKK